MARIGFRIFLFAFVAVALAQIIAAGVRMAFRRRRPALAKAS